MASRSKEKEVSSVPTEDSSIAELKTQHEHEMQKEPRIVWDIASILEKLRHTERSFLFERFFDSNTILHLAANTGHVQTVETILSIQQCQELLTAKNSYGDLPLHVAANAGHLSIAQQLVKSSHQNSNVNVAFKQLTVKNKEGNTPLHLALIKKYEEVDMNLKSNYNEVAKFLIEAVGSMRDDQIVEDKYSLDMARKAEDAELLELMRKSRIIELRICKTAQSDAEMRRRAYINSIKPELEIGTQKSKDKVTSMDPNLYKAVKSKDIDFIKIIAQDTEQPSLSDKTPELNTILHLAAASLDDDHQFVQATLEILPCQKFVMEKNSNGDLPLHVAASAGNMQILNLLVKLSNEQLKDHCDCVPLVEKNMEENTPLHLTLIKKFQVGRNSALKAKYNKVAKFLVEKCPEVSFYPNKEHKSPLYLAAEGGDEELVKHMITTNRLPCGKSIVHAATYYLMTIANLPYGKSIVHTAIYGSFTARKKDILDTVLESLPNDILTVKDDKGMTPLFYAVSIGYLKGVESILGKTTKCCVYERDMHGYYPIHIASKKGHIKVVEKFLHIYPDMIELLTEEGQNILHIAAMNGKAKMVAYMLKMHDLKVEMLVNNEDKNGNTPLHLASMKGHPDVVSVLTWDKRVHLKSMIKDGKRALDIAKKYSGENPSIKERLTWEVLRYVSGPRAPPPSRPISGENQQISKVGKPQSTDKYKERIGTLLLVATLVATLTFAASFTMPGGYNGPGGVATFREKHMFHVFVISNAIAMYSAITVVVALSWAHLGDHDLLIAAFKFTVPIMGLALTMVSVAFMAGNYLVLRDLNWLAYLVLSIGSFSLFIVWVIFLPLCLQCSYPRHILRDILHCSFYRLIEFTKGDAHDREEE